MEINENDFFRQATLRICSSLDIQTALRNSLLYLSAFMPVDEIFLHLYEPNLGTIRTLVGVRPSGGITLDRVIPLSQSGRKSLENDMAHVRIVNDPERDPVVAKIAESLIGLNASVLLMRLYIEGERLGTVSLAAEGKGRYTDEHAKLLAVLNEPFAIAVSNALRYEETLRLKNLLTEDNRYLHQELLRLSGDEIIGSDFGLREVMEKVRHVAPLNSPVLILGETGVGKGVIASAIHLSSPRKKFPFITVNSGAIPETLLDSELFGHEKGAFTGAVEQKRGRFERADKGTIFLDEVGELPQPAQVRMLRVLQEKEIERVGGTKPISVDIRIIAATHRDLRAMMQKGEFREDLWFRLNVFPIVVPPLRERRQDIPSLVHHFIQKKSRELKLPAVPTLGSGALERLLDYSWPGNVRELENAVERELILYPNEPLSFAGLGAGAEHEPQSALTLARSSQLRLDEINAGHIRQVLQMTHGVVQGKNGAAAILGIHPSTLRSRMKKLGVPTGKITKYPKS